MPSTWMIASPAWQTRAWLFALLAVASGPALRAQTLYEWREPNGTVVYSQLAPLLKEGATTRAIHLHDLSGPERATAVRVAAQSLPVAPPDQRPLGLQMPVSAAPSAACSGPNRRFAAGSRRSPVSASTWSTATAG